MNLPDCDENTCDNCKNVFYTESLPGILKIITAPRYCPFCGIKFNYTRKTEGVKV